MRNLAAVNKKNIFIVVVVFLLLIASFVYFLFFTTKGAALVTSLVFSHRDNFEKVTFGKVEGHLADGLTLTNIELRDFKWLPEGNIICIQKLFLNVTSFGIDGIILELDNVRVRLSDSDDPIVINGTLKDGQLDFNIYTKNIDIREFLQAFPDKELKKLRGTIDDIDVFIKGTYARPHVTGEFNIEKIAHEKFTAANCKGELDITLDDIGNEIKLDGAVLLNSGTLSGPKTAFIRLQPSKILFSGSPSNPGFDCQGTSTIERTKINIVLKGTLDAPDLRLSSAPAMSQDKLLVMLATNRSWRGAEEIFGSKKISAELARDFIDYFAFASEGNRMAQKFGISDILVKYEGSTKGVGIKKEISSTLEGSYGIEQTQQKGKTSQTTQRVGGEYKVTKEVSISAEKELRQKTKGDASSENEKTNDNVMLRYKKNF